MEMHKDSIVRVDRITGVFCLFLNIFLVGSGTMLAGCCAQRGNSRQRTNNFIVGSCQMMLFPYAFLGWFWSVYTGWLIFDRSGGDWMGFKRATFVSEEEKREHKAKERIKQFVKYKVDGRNKAGADVGADDEYWKAQFMKSEMPELDDESGTEYWTNLLSIYRSGKKK